MAAFRRLAGWHPAVGEGSTLVDWWAEGQMETRISITQIADSVSDTWQRAKAVAPSNAQFMMGALSTLAAGAGLIAVRAVRVVVIARFTSACSAQPCPGRVLRAVYACAPCAAGREPCGRPRLFLHN